MPGSHSRKLEGVVVPSVDERALQDEARKLSDSLDNAASLTPTLDTTRIRRSITREFERIVPGGSFLTSSASGGTGGRVGGSTYQTDALDLDRVRNDLLRELIETQEEGDFDEARRGGGGADGVLGAVGLLGLAGAVGTLDGLSLPELEPPAIPPLDVPTIPPLDVPDIPPLTVPNIPALEAPDIPPIPVDAPTSIPITFELPSTTPDTIDDPSPTTGPSEQPFTDGTPSPSPSPLTPPELETPEGFDDGGDGTVPDGFPVTPPDLSPPAVAAGGGAVLSGLLARELARGLGRGTGGSPTAAAPFALPAIFTTETTRRGQERENPNVIERFFARLAPDVGRSTASTQAFTTRENRATTETQSISAEVNVSVDGTDEREVERITERKAEELRDELERNLRGSSF